MEKIEYDLAGNKTAVHDVLGGVTRTTYTARNQPIQISYPDGSQERYQYNGNGSVAKHTATNGITTVTYYDSHLRPVRKCFYDGMGNFLYDTLATYQGTLIASESDANGIVTSYKYDGAGRLIEKRKGNQQTQYTYDSLGRRFKTTEWADANMARVTIHEYDILDRATEERIEDLTGKLYSRHQYIYDRRGNCCLHLTTNSQGLAITKTEYDSRHRPIHQTDALGNITVTEYEENYPQGIIRTTVTDALGHQTITTQNSVGQVTELIRKDLLGQICAQSAFFYDAAGRKVRQLDTAMAPGLTERKIVTEWTYDSMGRLLALTEAVGTPEQKRTAYSYNARGQKETITLHDGTQLCRTYNSLGYLQRYFTSDNSIDYSYEYDLNGNLLKVTDALTQTTTHREYDDQDRVTRETLANQLSLSYIYDNLSRPVQVVFPDGTSVKYAYDACHLKTVSRNSERPYEHHYNHYDLSGAVLEESSVVGEITYERDLLNRPRAIQSAYFNEIIPQDGYDAVGNLLSKTRQDSEREVCSHYAYDSLYQMQSEAITGFESQNYLYDSLNNRRLYNNQEYTTNHLNQLLSVEETAYTYDKRGNLIVESGPIHQTEYQYDALGRLTSLSRDGLRYEYQYDAFNRRIRENHPTW